MRTFANIFVVSGMAQEFLGWLPCLVLQATRRALRPDTLQRLRRHVERSQRGVPTPRNLSYQQLLRHLWDRSVRPLFQHLYDGPFHNDITHVILRYASTHLWPVTPGFPVPTEEIAELCFDLCCRGSIALLREHGEDFECPRYRTTLFSRYAAPRSVQV